VTELEFLFISPEGQILDTLHRGSVTTPQAVTLPNGIFLTYFNYEVSVSKQILIWANYDGTITREDTLDLNFLQFVYAEAANVTLVEYNPHWVGPVQVIDATLRPFAADGTPLTPEPLYNETLPQDLITSGVAFDYSSGELRTLIATFWPDSTPTTYNLRLIRHTPGSTIVYDVFNPGPFPPQHFATHWTITPGPWNTSVIGFAVIQNSVEQQVWIEGVTDNGQSTGLVHIVTMPNNQQVTAGGIRVLVNGGTVYANYTTAPLPGGNPGGAFLTGFPQEEILAADDGVVLPPSSFVLSAYPNPFNATVRLDYSIATAGPVTLTVFDLTGREVSTLTSGMKDAGRHSISWTADNLPSGIYLARLSAGNVSHVQKLVLLK
jgi:hypothetical protein